MFLGILVTTFLAIGPWVKELFNTLKTLINDRWNVGFQLKIELEYQTIFFPWKKYEYRWILLMMKFINYTNKSIAESCLIKPKLSDYNYTYPINFVQIRILFDAESNEEL